MSKFAGRVAVVTGAASGIGRALAIALAKRGAHVAISDVNEQELLITADLVKQAGGAVHSHYLDVSNAEDVTAYAKTVQHHYGAVHQLYNNAGIASTAGLFESSEPAIFDKVLAVNLWGVIHATRAFLPLLIASGEGHLTNISSLNGYLAQSRMSAYCTSKFAVRGFTESIRAEMLSEGHRVSVSVVHPGGVATNISTASLAYSGELTPDERAEAKRHIRVYNEKLLRMPATRAADIILSGVASNRSRILVGYDAKAVDLLVRLFPSHYAPMVTWFERRTFEL